MLKWKGHELVVTSTEARNGVYDLDSIALKHLTNNFPHTRKDHQTGSVHNGNLCFRGLRGRREDIFALGRRVEDLPINMQGLFVKSYSERSYWNFMDDSILDLRWGLTAWDSPLLDLDADVFEKMCMLYQDPRVYTDHPDSMDHLDDSTDHLFKHNIARPSGKELETLQHAQKLWQQKLKDMVK